MMLCSLGLLWGILIKYWAPFNVEILKLFLRKVLMASNVPVIFWWESVFRLSHLQIFMVNVRASSMDFTIHSVLDITRKFIDDSLSACIQGRHLIGISFDLKIFLDNSNLNYKILI